MKQSTDHDDIIRRQLSQLTEANTFVSAFGHIGLITLAKQTLISMRPKHSIKNTFIFLPIIFSKNLFNGPILFNGFIVFLLFSLLSGCVYIINDIADAKNDRLHPVKRLRPIASGNLPVPVGMSIAISVAIAVLSVAFYVNLQLGGVLLTYALINYLYSYLLKNMIILDVFVVATGFLLRVIAGCIVSLVAVSPWTILTTFMLSLLLALGKRRGELFMMNDKSAAHRPVLSQYNLELLNQFLTVSLVMTILSYCLFTVSEYAVAKFETTNLIYTFPFVVYGTFRYLYLLCCKNYGDNPTTLVFHDLPLAICILLWAITCVAIIYIPT